MNEEEPIMAAAAVDLPQRQQRTQSHKVALTLHHNREPQDVASLEETRAAFDQAVQLSTASLSVQSNHQLHQTLAKLSLVQIHIIGKKQSFLNLKRTPTSVSHLLPRNILPKETKVLCSVIACKVKPTDDKHMWKLQACHCVDGKPMEKGVDFEESCSPVVDPSAVRAACGMAASENLPLKILDVANAFQNAFRNPDQRIHIACPPFCIEWFKKLFPKTKFDDSKTGCVSQEDEVICCHHIDSTTNTKHSITNNLAFFADADHGCSLIDRRSVSSVLFAALGTS